MKYFAHTVSRGVPPDLGTPAYEALAAASIAASARFLDEVGDPFWIVVEFADRRGGIDVGPLLIRNLLHNLRRLVRPVRVGGVRVTDGAEVPAGAALDLVALQRWEQVDCGLLSTRGASLRPDVDLMIELGHTEPFPQTLALLREGGFDIEQWCA